MNTQFDWQKWAKDFGYTDDEAGISAVQTMYGVPATGVMDELTARVITRIPRCGISDAQQANASQSRWGIREISYFITSYPTGLGLTTDQVDQVFAQAFGAWAAVVDLVFSVASSPSNANIVVGTGRGQRAGFDGPSGVLAYCQLPPSGSYKGQLQMMLDLDEAWTVSKTANGILLLNVVTHELGHGLGLSHNSVPNNLLNPYYKASIATPQAYDKQDILTRYPATKAAPSPAPSPTPGGGQYQRAVKVQWDDGSVWGGTLARL